MPKFAVILPATETAGACVVAERIRAAVEASVTVCGDQHLKVTCSLGLSQVEPKDDVAKLIRRADDSLYASKKAGRNCGHWTDGANFFPITSTENLPTKEEDEPADAAEPADSKSASGTTFIQILKRRVTESHRFGIPLTLMHLKIDEYDSVSQKSGKAIARQMLDLAEPALEKALREMDVLARLDHGEFIVMLPGNTQAEAAQLVKRMRITMSNCIVPLKDREIHVRFRHGIAELKSKETAQELLARVRHDAANLATPRRTADV